MGETMTKKLTDEMIVTKKLTARRSFIKAGVGLFTLAGLALSSRKARAEDDSDEVENDEDQAEATTDETENDTDQVENDTDEVENDTDQG